MIYNFKVEGVQYMVDTEALTWAQASSIISAPSIKAAESNLAHFVPQKEGKLIPLSNGRFALEGKKPFDEKGKPQFAIFIILTLLSAENEGVCISFIQGNVPLTDLQHQQIKHFHAQCLPPFQLNPKQVGKIHLVEKGEGNV